jgi:hypothetical protein
MADLQSKPLVAEGGQYRLEPYAQPSDPSLAGLPKSVAKSATASKDRYGNYDIQVPNEKDFELTPEEVGHLQNAAANGDGESLNFLKMLGLPLGAAAAIGSGVLLRNALKNRGQTTNYPGYGDVDVNGNPKFVNANDLPPSPYEIHPGDNIVSPAESLPAGQQALPAPPQQKLLPAPQGKITDTTRSRFNQPGPPQQQLLPDANRIPREVDAAYAQKAAQDAAEAQRVALEKAAAQSRSMRVGRAARQASHAIRRGL